MFIGFTNLYQHFIWGFNKIAAPLISLLKIIRLSKSTPKAFRVDNNEIVCYSSYRANKIFMNSSKNKKSKDLTYVPNIGAMRKPKFPNPNA